MGRFSILLSGHLTPTARLRAQLQNTPCIAADGGMRHAASLGIRPELWVGDFDSTPLELLHDFAEVPRLEFPAAKDQTDGELAINAALERGATELLLVGALGGQTDHTLAHLTLAVRLARSGTKVILTSGLEEAHPVIPGRLRPGLPPRTKFSLLPLSNLDGLTLRGAEWPLERVSVELGNSLTLSNVVREGLEVELVSGYGVLIAQV
ncbi:MAG: thiamine diphosphokinase [Meiothermus sp.]|nr:thiamine diphosphokinase [Meiothermus sp.]